MARMLFPWRVPLSKGSRFGSSPQISLGPGSVPIDDHAQSAAAEDSPPLFCAILSHTFHAFLPVHPTLDFTHEDRSFAHRHESSSSPIRHRTGEDDFRGNS